MGHHWKIDESNNNLLDRCLVLTDQQGKRHHDEAENENDENGGSVARILLG